MNFPARICLSSYIYIKLGNSSHYSKARRSVQIVWTREREREYINENKWDREERNKEKESGMERARR